MTEKKRKNNSPNQTDNVGWRPIWSFKYSVEEMYQKSQEYFKHCNETMIENSYWKKIPKPKTLSWLCLWLKVSKDYISEKAKDKTFSEVIKLIRLEVENDIELNAMLWFYNSTIAAKNLSANCDWRDKTEVDSTNKNVDLNDTLSDEQKKLIANRIINGNWSNTINEASS